MIMAMSSSQSSIQSSSEPVIWTVRDILPTHNDLFSYTQSTHDVEWLSGRDKGV